MVKPTKLRRRPMLHLRVPPGRSGLDIFSSKTITSLDRAGIATSLDLIWPQSVYQLFNSGWLPLGRRFFRAIVAPFYANKILHEIKAGDVLWIPSFCVPEARVPNVERKLKMAAVSYIFHLMDDWFNVDFLREGTIERCKLAALVGVPTPQLAERVREMVPSVKVGVFEEPIDLDRLRDNQTKHFTGKPVVLWCGNPYNLRLIGGALDILRHIRKRIPYTLRIVCGEQPSKNFSDGLDIEWKQFNHEAEGQLVEGSWLGIAPMPDTAYNRCKGAYKVKTYLAAGLPVVASPVGFQSELVRGGNGVGLLPESPAEWEQAISTLLGNPSLCAQMGAKARSYAEQRFSYSATTPHWAGTLLQHFPSLARPMARFQ